MLIIGWLICAWGLQRGMHADANLEHAGLS
jgi:hypothetical protein